MDVLGKRAPTHELGSDEDDERTLIAAARHDRRAFAPLYARYAAPIFQYCYGQLGSREAAEDATSAVFAKALAALPRYRDGSFRSWLFTIAHNTITDHFRAARRETPIEAAAEIVAPGPALDDVASDEDARRRLRDLLAQLPADQRSVIELRLMELNGPEIAAVLGRSHAWVRVTQFRAVARLRTLMSIGAEPSEARHDAL
jgi:RNA polymerase sigma-70 factor (ECF subfamily)